MTKKACVISGCKGKDFADLFYKHQQFCKSHYAEAFQGDLSILFKEWDGINEPPDRLKYLIGRYYDEHETALIGKPSLTKRIVHEGSYDWKKPRTQLFLQLSVFLSVESTGEPHTVLRPSRPVVFT